MYAEKLFTSAVSIKQLKKVKFNGFLSSKICEVIQKVPFTLRLHPSFVLRNLSEKRTVFRDLNLDQPRNKSVEILGKDAKGELFA